MKATAAKLPFSLSHAAAQNYVLECTKAGEAINAELVGLYLGTRDAPTIQRLISDTLDSRDRGATHRKRTTKAGLKAAEARLRKLAVVFGVDADDCEEE